MIEIFCTQCPDIAYIIAIIKVIEAYIETDDSLKQCHRKEKLVLVPTKKGGKMGRCGWNL